MKLLFVTSRFECYTLQEAAFNIDRVTFVATRLMLKGYAVYVPLTAQHARVPQSPVVDLVFESNPNKWRQIWDTIDAEMIKRSDGVYVCVGAGNDQRVRAHINIATQLKKQVFFEGIAEP